MRFLFSLVVFSFVSSFRHVFSSLPPPYTTNTYNVEIDGNTIITVFVPQSKFFNVPGLDGLNCPQYNIDQRGSWCSGLNTAYTVNKSSWQLCSNQCYYSRYTILGLCQQFTYDSNTNQCLIKDGDTSCAESSQGYITAHNPAIIVGECSTTCKVSEWSEWSPCSINCVGNRVRSRYVTSHPIFDSDYCPHLTEFANCNTNQECPPTCPQYGIAILGWGCQMESEFSFSPNVLRSMQQNWFSCLRQCQGDPLCVAWAFNSTSPIPNIDTIDFGICYVHRYAFGCQIPSPGWISGYPNTVGSECPSSHCKYNDWSHWSTCSNRCSNSEHQTRSRSIQSSNIYLNSLKCEDQTQYRVCSEDPSNINYCTECLTSSWSDWSPCSSSCGGGSRIRTRKVIKLPANSNMSTCPTLKSVEVCNEEIPCTIKTECKVGEWSSWSPCSTSCNGGHSTRHRNVTGNHCPEDTQTITCNENDCSGQPSIKALCNGIMTTWSSWSSCSEICGPGESYRTRTFDKSKIGIWNYKPPGTPSEWKKITILCNGTEMLQSQNCTTGQPCSDNCEIGAWSKWTICNCTGIQSRERSVNITNNHSHICPNKVEIRNCTEPIDCYNKTKEYSKSPPSPGKLNLAAAIGTPLAVLGVGIASLITWLATRNANSADDSDEGYQYLDHNPSSEQSEEFVQELGPESSAWAE
ncbi:thrombospondin type 1 domain-containing protein [Cryptosporidium muris RN66]|uniref:Thrombospondin type 1 domain-containing protein n=2 Tax=Cryptosporidium muris TaxID=5808 RepID=B6AJC9_CRYMR|nr:thrombospondin type 1 domain-containing protein [Cryptosporidium muris RN66]EEA08267.1 thrombospondin type 1 domain-containing protein [Cryptosporidium muris RN66]|eukprot:XP_002142616.1 thrombospondin type 1 domain-containing protein [Cryptosporidium muris RN66]